jgi:hypothetical protein
MSPGMRRCIDHRWNSRNRLFTGNNSVRFYLTSRGLTMDFSISSMNLSEFTGRP